MVASKIHRNWIGLNMRSIEKAPHPRRIACCARLVGMTVSKEQYVCKVHPQQLRGIELVSPIAATRQCPLPRPFQSNMQMAAPGLEPPVANDGLIEVHLSAWQQVVVNFTYAGRERTERCQVNLQQVWTHSHSKKNSKASQIT